MNVNVGSIHNHTYNHTYNHTTTQIYHTLCNTNDHVQCLIVLKSYDIFPLCLIYEERQEEKRKQKRREEKNEINTQRKNYHTLSCEKDCTWFYFRDNVDFFCRNFFGLHWISRYILKNQAVNPIEFHFVCSDQPCKRAQSVWIIPKCWYIFLIKYDDILANSVTSRFYRSLVKIYYS